MSDTSSINLLDLDGRVALVTGGGQGVGAKTAQYLGAYGAKVVVNDYVGERADSVAAEINDAGGTAIGIQCDVTDYASVLSMVDQAADSLGAVDVLVNNAGNAGATGTDISRGPFWESDPSDWEPFLRVNLYGVLYCCRAIIPGMLKAGNGGRLITIISDAGRVGEVGFEAYSGAKSGAAGVMRTLARGLGRYDVTANSVAIAATRTPATEAMTENAELAKRVLSNYILRRFGEPSDVAALVTFLASPSAGWITGQTYPVNGGFSVNL